MNNLLRHFRHLVHLPLCKHLLCFWLLLCAFYLDSNAQTTQISGIVNHYAAVTAIDTCSGKLTVSDTTGFKTGMAVLLIQMQGADISSSNNFLYGIIQTMNFAGRYERAVIDSVRQNAIFVQKKLVYTFNLPGKLQVVSVPQYPNVTVTDTLRCQPWNGTTGGVLALEVAGTLTLNAPVVADGAGFRGGAAYIGPGNNCNFLVPEVSYYYPLGSWRGGRKGEGIALMEAGKELGRGPQANGGGGGNDHNAGGGGGANITDGGNGGDNDEPSALGCDGYYPGVRGYGIFFTTQRMFMGGGGGAGHSNNTLSSAGANGGGIVVIQAGDINGSNPSITANGLSAPAAQGDGAGGGGAGGTIWLKADAGPANLTVRANGGKGGNTLNNNQNRCFGPGGGGAGGRILTNLTGIASPQGGQVGVVASSTNACNGSSSDAGAGEAGLAEALPDIPQGIADYELPEILSVSLPDTVCPGDMAVFTVQTNDGNWEFQWQSNNGTGWQNIANGVQFGGSQTDTLTISNVTTGQNGLQFRCRVSRPGCYETISLETILVTESLPSVGFATFVNGFVANFVNQSNAVSYFWDFGDGATSQAVDPQHTYATEGTFTVVLYAITPCDTAVLTQNILILSPPTAGFTFPPSSTGCGTVEVAFTNTSSPNATDFLWSFVGGFPATSTLPNPTVTYTATGIYQVTLQTSNAAGQDVSNQFVVVTVNPSPIADFTFFVQPDGTVQFADQSQNATNVLWDFGDNTTSSDPAPSYQYATDGNYTVTLTAWNGCDTVSIQQTVAAFFPPAAGFFVQDSVVGCQTAVVEFENTSSPNATSFNWNFPGGNPGTSNTPNPSISYANSGTYTAQLIASNGIGADTLEQTFAVQLYGFPTANFNYTAYPGGVLRFTNLSQESTSYTWDFGDGYPQVNGVNIDHQYAASGTYTVTLIASSPCGVSVLQQNIEVIVNGVTTGEPQGLGTVLLFPNPASDWLTVDCSKTTSQPVEMQIFDAGGHLVLSNVFNPVPTLEVSLTGLAAGPYQVMLRFEKGRLTKTVLKQ